MLQSTIGSGQAYGSLADPPGSSVLLAAVAWVEGTLLGTAATVVAIIAIAWLGFAMLDGRLRIRSGAAAVLGCFILLGASAIVAGLRSSLGSAEPAPASYPPTPPPPPAPAPPSPPPPAAADPYAGASVPSD